MNERSQEMVLKAKEILKKITFSGGEAYIIGEAVFHIINGENIEKMDIYSNIDEKELYSIFSENSLKSLKEDEYELGYLGHKYNIITNRNPHKKPKTIGTIKHYSKLLTLKMCEMDYSIFSLAMNQNNIVYDFFNGRKDINKRVIKSIYINPKTPYDADPSKMLDIIRFVSETGFKLDKRIIKAIRKRRKKINNLSLDQITYFMKKIFDGKYFKKAIKLLYKTKLYKSLEWYKDIIHKLAKGFRKENEKFFFGYGMIKKEIYEGVIGKYLENEYDFQMFVNLAVTNPQAEYDKLTLYTYGLDNCLLANRINYLLGRSKKNYRKIKANYNSLPIKKTCDLKFKGQDILDLNPQLSTNEIAICLDEVIQLVLEGNLENEREVLKSFMLERLGLNKPLHKEEKFVEERYGLGEAVYKEINEKQVELSKPSYEDEIKSLLSEIEIDIEKKINESGILENVLPEQREKTKDSLYRTYYEALINTDKYQKLKNYKPIGE